MVFQNSGTLLSATLSGTFFFVTLSAWAGDDFGANCQKYSSNMLKKKIEYCVQRSKPNEQAKPGEPVAYFMHGIRGNAKAWIRDGFAEAYETLGKEQDYPAMTVVSFDTDGMSFFSDPKSNHEGRSSYETWFLTEFVPKIEKDLSVCSERKCRGLIGVSMGGFGAIKTGLRHPEMFSVISVNTPALLPFKMSSSVKKWFSYFSKHPVGPAKGLYYLYKVRKIFPKNTKWGDFNDPALIARNFLDPALAPELYFDVGTKDDYGFQVGFERFKKELDDRDFEYTSELVPNGTHDIVHERRWPMLRFLGNHIPRTRANGIPQALAARGD